MADGLRIGVVGAGPAGSAFAGALLASSRAFGRKLQVVLYDAPAPSRRVAVPALLDPESRSRLATLGVPVALPAGATDVQGILVHSAGSSILLPPPPGGLWIIDGERGLGGERAIRQSLVAAATVRGGRVLPFRVDSVDALDAGYVVRAQGSAETFDLVAGAFGAGSTLAGRWMDGRFQGPPCLLSSHARVTWKATDDLLRVCLAPTAEVDLLMALPCGDTAYVIAIGAAVSTDALARALMALARDGALPGGTELLTAERVAVSGGAGRRSGDGRLLTLGAALFGSVLEPGMLPALVSAMRSANAVLEVGATPALPRRMSRVHRDLASHARRQVKLLQWARRAGPRAPQALAQVALADNGLASFGGTLLGMTGLPSSSALSRMRREGILRTLSSLFSLSPEPFPEPPVSQPLVYVVDDDPDIRGMLSEYLSSRGATVRTFGGEVPLLESAAKERPAAILLDVVLPWVDGLSLCRDLRHHQATARIRIISMSNLNRPADRGAALAAGADLFLPKPIDFTELERVMRGVLRPIEREPSREFAQAR